MKKYLIGIGELDQRLHEMIVRTRIGEYLGEFQNVIRDRHDKNIRTIVFAVPKSGQCAAHHLINRFKVSGLSITYDPSEAHIIFDDVIDSGRTRERFKDYHVPFVALVDKTQEDEPLAKEWVVFPWDSEAANSGPTDAVVRLIQSIGEDPKREGLRETPERVIKAFAEMASGYDDDPEEILSKTFKQKCDSIIVLSPIRFTSICEHHLLPFVGRAAVGYIPKSGAVVGLSKLARLVHCFARRLQLQERLTEEIALALMKHVEPQGVAVVLKAHHSCMGCRGVNDPDARMITSKMTGLFRGDEADVAAGSARSEFMQLIQGDL